jgi:Flp pilus assembly protein TadD
VPDVNFFIPICIAPLIVKVNQNGDKVNRKYYCVQAVNRSGITVGFFLLLLFIVLPVTAADTAEQYYGDGVNLSNLGQYADAVAAYDKAVSLQPDNADIWNYRGIALANLGLYSEAVTSYDKAVSLRPVYTDAWNNRGVALRELGRYADAIVSYDKAIASSPGYADAWLNRGVALDYLGRYDEAIASYDKALALQPDYTTALENRKISLAKKSPFSPATIGILVFVLMIIFGTVYWYTKSRSPSGQKEPKPDQKPPGRLAKEEKRPETKKLMYGIIPEESKLHTMASLCCIININGVSLLDDPGKVAALLNELSRGEYERERNALIVALKDTIPQELLKPRHGFSWASTSARLKKRLTEDHGMPDDLAQWVVETWAKALETEK